MSYGFLGWVFVGLIAGVLAKWIKPGEDPGGIVVTILIGVAGGLIGGMVSQWLGLGGHGNFVNILIATAGAVVLLWVYGLLRAEDA